MKKTNLARIVDVKPLKRFCVRLKFDDGLERVVDLEPYLWGPVFAPLHKSRKKFLQVRVDPEMGTIAWPNGADLCPDVLYHGGTPPWAKACLRRQRQHA